MADLLSRKSYREVVRNLDHFRKQHEEDRKENPNMIPCSWGSPLRAMIERTVRSNGERCYRGLPDLVLDYLCEKDLLIKWCGDYTFPTEERLPTKTEIEREALKLAERLTR